MRLNIHGIVQTRISKKQTYPFISLQLLVFSTVYHKTFWSIVCIKMNTFLFYLLFKLCSSRTFLLFIYFFSPRVLRKTRSGSCFCLLINFRYLLKKGKFLWVTILTKTGSNQFFFSYLGMWQVKRILSGHTKSEDLVRPAHQSLI